MHPSRKLIRDRRERDNYTSIFFKNCVRFCSAIVMVAQAVKFTANAWIFYTVFHKFEFVVVAVGKEINLSRKILGKRIV